MTARHPKPAPGLRPRTVSQPFTRRVEFRTFITGTLVLLLAVSFSNRWMISTTQLTATTLYNIACGLGAAGDVGGAVRFYVTALHLNPHHVMALNNLGIIRAAEGDLTAAEAHFKRALSFFARSDKVHNNLAMVHLRQGRLKDAHHHFKTALALNPDYDVAIYYNMACVTARMGRQQTALAWLNEALRRGYDRCEHICTDPDLALIRNTQRFAELMASCADVKQ